MKFAGFRQRVSEHFRWHAENLKVRALLAWLDMRNRVSRRTVLSSSGLTVSITTHGARIDAVHLTLETIARGTSLPGRLILWLDDPEKFDRLPDALQRLRNRGLEVMLCENFGPHTKYYPYLEAQADIVGPLVTADDDELYPRSWLSDLVAAYEKDDGVINCHCARTVRLEGQQLAPYVTWPFCTTTEPSFRNFVTGVSGVIYPPRFLKHLKSAGREFLTLCPKADDVWLHVNAVRRGFKVRQIKPTPARFAGIPGTQSSALYHVNIFGGGNDEQISRTYQPSDIMVLSSDLNGSENLGPRT